MKPTQFKQETLKIKIKISVFCIALIRPTAFINNTLSSILNVSVLSEMNAVRKKKMSLHISCCVNNVV